MPDTDNKKPSRLWPTGEGATTKIEGNTKLVQQQYTTDGGEKQ